MSLELKQIYNLTFLSDLFLHYLYIMHGQKYFNDKEQCEWIDTSLNIAPLSRGSEHFSSNFLSTYRTLLYNLSLIWVNPVWLFIERDSKSIAYFSPLFLQNYIKQHCFISWIVHYARCHHSLTFISLCYVYHNKLGKRLKTLTVSNIWNSKMIVFGFFCLFWGGGRGKRSCIATL